MTLDIASPPLAAALPARIANVAPALLPSTRRARFQVLVRGRIGVTTQRG